MFSMLHLLTLLYTYRISITLYAEQKKKKTDL